MSGLFGGSPKYPEPAPPTPMIDEEAVKKARLRAAQMKQQSGGRASTILTRPNEQKLGE